MHTWRLLMEKLIVLTNNTVLIAKIEELNTEMGEPDCKLINPFVVGSDDHMESYLHQYTNRKEIKIHSDKILTITDPKPLLLDKYQKFTE